MPFPQRSHRRPARMSHTVAACVLSLSLLAIGGCSGQTTTQSSPATRLPQATMTPDVPVESTSPSSSPEAAAAETTAPPSVSSTMTDVDYVCHFYNQAGYTYDLRLAVGAPVPYEPGMTLFGDDVGGFCHDLTAGTDAVIPVTRTMTATTAGYATMISTKASVIGSGYEYTGSGVAPMPHDDRLYVEQFFSGGKGTCHNMSSDARGADI